MSEKYITKSCTTESISAVSTDSTEDTVSIQIPSPRFRDQLKLRAKSAPPKPDTNLTSTPTKEDEKTLRKGSLSARILERSRSSLSKQNQESRIRKLKKKRVKIIKTIQKLEKELNLVDNELNFQSGSPDNQQIPRGTPSICIHSEDYIETNRPAWSDKEDPGRFLSPNVKGFLEYIDEEHEYSTVTEDSIEIFTPRYKTNPKVKGFLEYVEDNDYSDDDEEFVDDSFALNVSAKGFLDYIDEETNDVSIQEEIEIINEYEQDRSNEIAKRIRGQWVIQAGTVEQLVNRLASANPIDGYYTRNFILTYSYFTTAHALLGELEKRFKFEPPLEATLEVISYYEKWKGPVRLRVINVLKKWIELNFSDVRKDPLLLEKFILFAKEIGQEYEKWGDSLLQIIKREEPIIIDENFIENDLTPKTYVPQVINKGLEIETFSDMHPSEIARQLTVYEWKIFVRIEPTELRSGAWGKANKQILAPNVVQITTWFNKLSYWIATEIIKPDVKIRVKNLILWISVAEECRKLKNFNSCMEVIAALGLICVSRLKRTWKELPEKYKLMYQDLEELMTSFQNFKNYRRELDKADDATNPTLPYVGVFLRDLLFVEEGNPDRLENGMIHFSKMSMVANFISRIQQFQRLPYNIKPVDQIQAFFQRQQDGLILDEDTLFEYSKIYEPSHSLPMDRPVPMRERRMTITDFRSFVRKQNFSPLPNVPSSRPTTPPTMPEGVTPPRHNSVNNSTKIKPDFI